MKKFILTKKEIAEAVQSFIDSKAGVRDYPLTGEIVAEGMFEHIDEEVSQYYGNDLTEIDKVITEQVDKLPLTINAMEPTDRGHFLIALMEYRDGANDFEF